MAGAGYKLFNTGDVLLASEVNTYLMQQTVMVFANSAARTTALSGVLAEGMVSYLQDTNVVEIYNGSAWASLDDPNAIQNSIVDAKGDIITATADNVPARLAVGGTNGHVLTVDSSTSTGLKWAAPSGGVTGCVLYNSANLTVANATWTTVNWNSEVYDTDSYHSTSSNTSRITIPAGKGGKYLIFCNLTYDNNGTGIRWTRLLINGSEDYRLYGPRPSADGASSYHLFQIKDLTAGDYLEINTQQTSGGNLDLFFSGFFTYYGVQYLGA